MKLLFLDIDGVLNSSLSQEWRSHERHHVEAHYVNLLALIVNKTQCNVVISSTWRKDPNIVGEHKTDEEKIQIFKDYFKQYGQDLPIIGLTPNISGYRGLEVALYLDEFVKHHTLDDYVILDDDQDFILDFDSLSIYHQDKILQYKTNDNVYWNHQPLVRVNCLEGLNYYNVIDILQKWNPNDSLVEEYNAYQKFRSASSRIDKIKP